MALNLPKSHRAGDSFNLTVSLVDYPASSWDLVLMLVNEANSYSVAGVAGVANEDDHDLIADYTVTSQWASGNYRIVAQVTNGILKKTIAVDRFEILPDFVNSRDARSHVEKVLDAIESVLEGKATEDHLSITFDGRNIQHFAPEQLLVWRDKYKRELAQQKQAERLSAGLSSSKQVYVRLKV